MQLPNSTLNNQYAALEAMGITLWARSEVAKAVVSKISVQNYLLTDSMKDVVNVTFELNPIFTPEKPKYLVVLGLEGVWANPDQQTERRAMFKKLLQAIKWEWPECYVVEFKGAPAVDKLCAIVNQYGLEKAVVFGKDLKEYINPSHISTAFLPSFEQLLLNANFKREAWETLKQFISP